MKKHNRNVFTIIEVVLVLAVAGLIFMAIFLALPALQRSQRDIQRKQDVAVTVAALNEWRTNSRGAGFSKLGKSENGAAVNEGGISGGTTINAL